MRARALPSLCPALAALEVFHFMAPLGGGCKPRRARRWSPNRSPSRSGRVDLRRTASAGSRVSSFVEDADRCSAAGSAGPMLQLLSYAQGAAVRALAPGPDPVGPPPAGRREFRWFRWTDVARLARANLARGRGARQVVAQPAARDLVRAGGPAARKAPGEP